MREINYFGQGTAEQIESGLKLATLRWPSEKYEGFGNGERVMALCVDDDDKQVPTMINRFNRKSVI